MRIFLALFLVLALFLRVSAKEKVEIRPHPDWLITAKADLTKVPVNRDISNGYYFVLLEQQTSLLNNADYTHYIKQIVNESGIQNASEVSVTFAPEFQELIIHSITILREGEVINQLLPGAIKVVQEETDAADFQYNGLKRAFVTLKDVRKKDRIEVSYSLIGLNPVFGKKYTDEFYFCNETAVSNYFRTIITAANRKLIIRSSNNAPAPVEELSGGRYIYHWENPPIKSWESNSGAPSWYDNYPCIHVTEYANWQEVVDWGLSTFSNYHYPLPQSLKVKMAAWKKAAAGDPDAFANLATHFVQDEVRYLGLEIGPNTHRPHPPADVFTHRFGDCKDKALLLATILQSEGIRAYVALISTTTRNQLTAAVPSATAFNHAIVAISRSEDVFLYIDPTISGQGGELVNRYVPAYGYALVLREGENRLRPVEPGFLYSFDIVETVDVKDYDTSRFTVNTTYAGGAADFIRGNFAENSVKELEDSYKKYYADIFDGIQLEQPITSTDDSLKDEFAVKESYLIPQIWKTDKKDRRSIDFSAKTLAEYLPTPPAAATEAPLALKFPRTVNYTVSFNMPKDWGFDIEALHVKNDSYQFDFTPSVSSNHITIHYFFKSFKDHIPAAEIGQYKTDHKQISDRLYFELFSKNTSDPSTPSEVPATLSRAAGTAYWPAIWFTFFFAMFFTWLFKRLNARSEAVLYPHERGFPLGGWTIVLGVTLGLGLIAKIYYFLQNQFYSIARWQEIEGFGGRPLHYFFFTQLTFDLLFLGATSAMIYWFLQRRDIFPRMFIWYVGIQLSGQLALIIFLTCIHSNPTIRNFEQTMIVQFIRYCVYGAIWVSYVQRSGRVKSTFLRRY